MLVLRRVKDVAANKARGLAAGVALQGLAPLDAVHAIISSTSANSSVPVGGRVVRPGEREVVLRNHVEVRPTRRVTADGKKAAPQHVLGPSEDEVR